MIPVAETDWYATLDVSPDASDAEIEAAVARRSRQAAALANTAPERSQQLREQLRAIRRDLLSGPAAREAYDARLRGPAAEQSSVPVENVPAQHAAPDGYPARPRGFRAFLRSGWTCWNCGESAMPGDQYCTQCDAQLVQQVSWTPLSVPPASPSACPYCGTRAASNHRYCRRCGAGRPV